MSKWNDTNTTLRDESTFSEDVITSEEDIIVSTNMDADETDVNTSNLEFSEDTNFEPLKDAAWKEPRNPDPEPPRIQVFDVAAYILERIETMTTMKLQKLGLLQSSVVVGLG